MSLPLLEAESCEPPTIKDMKQKQERLIELLAFAKVCFEHCTNPFAQKYLIFKKVTADECKDLSDAIAEAIETDLWSRNAWTDKALKKAEKEFEEAEKDV